MQQPADREVPARRRRQLELLADAGGEQRDATGVLLGRGVPIGEPDEQRAHARAQVGLLGRHELGRREIADQRAGGAAAGKVERRRDADERDAAQLERVAAVERHVPGAVDKLGEERHGEPGAAGHDQQVGRALGQRVGAHGAVGEHGQAAQPPGQQGERRRTAGGRHHRDDRRERQRERAEREHADREDRLQDEQRGDPARAAQGRDGREREQRGADRQRGAAGERDHAVHADDHSGRREAVDREQRGSRRERGAEQDGPAVACADAGHRQAGGHDRGGAGGDDDGEEVRLRGEDDRLLADEHDDEQRPAARHGSENVAQPEAVAPSAHSSGVSARRREP